ncbi:hypothetical protein SALBM135S_04074 [Streptomyces alboniger]
MLRVRCRVRPRRHASGTAAAVPVASASTSLNVAKSASIVASSKRSVWYSRWQRMPSGWSVKYTLRSVSALSGPESSGVARTPGSSKRNGSPVSNSASVWKTGVRSSARAGASSLTTASKGTSAWS